MNIGRRSFLRMIGVGGVSVPLAAKAAVEAEVAALTTLAGHNATPMNRAVLGGGAGPPASGGYGQTGGVSPQIQMADYLKLWGSLPAHIERDVRERSKNVYHLDHDIANKRSWSLSVKIATQAQRNYDRDVQRYHHSGAYERAQGLFEKISGFRWQW